MGRTVGIGKEMRRLCGELVAELTLPAPARPEELYAALCDGMSRRRGRPVLFRTAAFPPGTASGLWLDMADQDLVVIEERTAPDHQLVILGHELWHMKAGHCSHHVEGAAVAARLLDDGADLEATVLKVARAPVSTSPTRWRPRASACCSPASAGPGSRVRRRGGRCSGTIWRVGSRRRWGIADRRADGPPPRRRGAVRLRRAGEPEGGGTGLSVVGGKLEGRHRHAGRARREGAGPTTPTRGEPTDAHRRSDRS